jgi:hypothetical protein
MYSKPVVMLRWFAVALAIALLAATLVWRIPFMLWDHLDFAPLYAAWRSGVSLSQTIFWRVHGGHLHSAAYAVLLATTWLSHGQTWLDCLVSWALLCLYAWIVFALCRKTLRFDDDIACAAAALILFLALYPGHLANLQWGWQVAVFLCLLGAASSIRILTAENLNWKGNILALLAAALALLSFGTALALLPIALLAIAARGELSLMRRIGLALPWVVCALLSMYVLRSDAGLVAQHAGASSISFAARLWEILHYTLDYLGSGIARFATGAAPWLALLALATAGAAIVATRGRRATWPWIGLLLFGFVGAVLTAFGRAQEGTDQAFVSRYVSFSSVFWCGCVGLVAMAAQAATRRKAAWIALGVVAVFALINAVAMTRRAERLAQQSRVTAATVCATWPQVDRALLDGMHYDGADAARERLQVVRALGFAPFDRCAETHGEHE